MIIFVIDFIFELFQYLVVVYDVIVCFILKEEMIWLLSMLFVLLEKDEEIIIVKLKNFEDVLY